MTGKGGQPATADILLRILSEHYWIGQMPNGEPFAARKDAPCVMIPFRGTGGLRQQLSATAAVKTAKVPSQEALANVLLTAEGMASGMPPRPAVLRCARREGIAYLDLGRKDGLTAVIRPGSWELDPYPPVLWRRNVLGGELPLPPTGENAGSMDQTRDLFNIPPGGAWATFVACRIASLLYPAFTHPVEIFTSDTSGSLKTATIKNTKAWTDPGLLIPVPRDQRAWATTAGNTYIAAIDNVSWIADWWSDLLCKGASGDSWADRSLYTNGEPFSAEFSIVPLLDGIGLVPVRADLADRTIRHHLRRPGRYLGDDEAAEAWERHHPAALAWLLDQAAAVAYLHASRIVERPRTGRLAVFEWTLAALDYAWGTAGTEEAGMKWFRASQRSVAHDTVAGDVLADAIASQIKAPCEVTPGELLSMLAGLADDGREPWTAQKVSKRMPRAADALTKLGWTLERSDIGHARTRKWTIAPLGWHRLPDTRWEFVPPGNGVPADNGHAGTHQFRGVTAQYMDNGYGGTHHAAESGYTGTHHAHPNSP